MELPAASLSVSAEIMVTKKAHQHWSQHLRVHIMRLPGESPQFAIRKGLAKR
jgi:hypothetical protein